MNSFRNPPALPSVPPRPRLSFWVARLSRHALTALFLLASCALTAAADFAPARAAAGRLQPGAERAWLELQELAKPLPTPAEWQREDPGVEVRRDFDRRNAERAGEGADQARDFYTRFAADPRAALARGLEYELLGAAVRLGNTNRLARLLTVEEERLKDRDLPEPMRFQIRMNRVLRPFTRPSTQDKLAQLEEIEKGALGLQKEFPKRPEVIEILSLVARAYLENDRLEPARRLFKQIVSAASGEAKDNARASLRALDRLGKPVKMRFITLQGGAVDLQALKGKVVLVDFWATWNEACRAALPELKTLYDRFHAQGFEIVGVNFDSDRTMLDACLQREKLPWPQYFDGRMWKNKIGQEFEITTLPTVWLLDKQGRLRYLNPSENLAPKIEKLLAEK